MINPTLVYYFTIGIVSAVLAKYITITDWEFWVVISGLVIARICGKKEE